MGEQHPQGVTSRWRKKTEDSLSTRKALGWVLTWFTLALAFCAGIWAFAGRERAIEFLGGYVVEYSLSVDNLFLFLMLFTSFGLTQVQQRRVLNYGIIGAIVLRLGFILLGSALVARFHWALYAFGGILILSAVRMAMGSDAPKDYRNNRALRLMGRVVPCTNSFDRNLFFVRKNGRFHATLLLMVLVLVELSDIVFAVDSIPAVFSITTDTFIVFTSNLFAILGLRSLYFVLQRLHESFSLVKYGVAAILAFTGIKLILPFFGIEIPVLQSIAAIAGILALSVLASIVREKMSNQRTAG